MKVHTNLVFSVFLFWFVGHHSNVSHADYVIEKKGPRQIKKHKLLDRSTSITIVPYEPNDLNTASDNRNALKPYGFFMGGSGSLFHPGIPCWKLKKLFSLNERGVTLKPSGNTQDIELTSTTLLLIRYPHEDSTIPLENKIVEAHFIRKPRYNINRADPLNSYLKGTMPSRKLMENDFEALAPGSFRKRGMRLDLAADLLRFSLKDIKSTRDPIDGTVYYKPKKLAGGAPVRFTISGKDIKKKLTDDTPIDVVVNGATPYNPSWKPNKVRAKELMAMGFKRQGKGYFVHPAIPLHSMEQHLCVDRKNMSLFYSGPHAKKRRSLGMRDCYIYFEQVDPKAKWNDPELYVHATVRMDPAVEKLLDEEVGG